MKAEEVDAVGAGQLSLHLAADAGLVASVDDEGTGVDWCLRPSRELDGPGGVAGSDDTSDPVLFDLLDLQLHLLGGEVSANTGLIADDKPPFSLYPANLNQIQPRLLRGNPFVAQLYRDRYFQFCPGIYKHTPVEALYSPVVDEPDY